MLRHPLCSAYTSVGDYGRCAEGSALYGVISNEAGTSLKSQPEEAEAKPVLEPIARRPHPLEIEAPQLLRFSCSS